MGKKFKAHRKNTFAFAGLAGALTVVLGLVVWAHNQAGLGGILEYFNTSPSSASVASNAPTIASTDSTKPTDFNKDGVVDAVDLQLLVSNFGTTNAEYDVNKDGAVTIEDYNAVISTWES